MVGKTTAQGYGWSHQQQRAHWRPEVEAGRVNCWRCAHLIQPWQDWDLGHDDSDPTKRTYRGPEHRHCNRKAGGEKGATRRGWPWRVKPRTRPQHQDLSVDPADL